MNGKRVQVIVLVSAVVLLILSLTSCGGGGGGEGGAGSLPQFKIVFKDVTAGGAVLTPLSRVRSAPSNTTGEAGSAVDSILAQVLSFELQKNDGTWVTTYSSAAYLEFVGSTGQTITDSIIGTMPPAGTYKGYRMTTGAIKIKLKLVQNGTTYYTTQQVVTQGTGAAWAFSTNSSEHDYITNNFAAPGVFQADFPTPLTVTDTSITLYHVSQRAGTISCDGSAANVDITYCSDDDISEGILPDSPKTMQQFLVTATTASTTPPQRTNTITAYFGEHDNFLGATEYRPADWYFNGSLMTAGTGAFSSAAKSGSLDLTFMDGDGIADGIFKVTADMDCSAKTFSNLVITPTGTGTDIYDTDYSLETSGSVACTMF